MVYRLRVLGPVTVSAADDPPSSSRVTQPRQLALLVYLALARPHGLHPREHIAELLWPRQSPEQVRRGLRNALHGLRLALGSDAILSVGTTLIGLNPTVIECDASELEAGRWVGPVTRLGDSGVEPLDGLHVDGAAEFEHWLATQRARLADALATSRNGARAAVRGDGAGTGRTEFGPPRRPLAKHSDDATALYLRGHYCFLRAAHDGDATTLQHCRTYFERALALEPAYADAMAGLANYYAVAARRGLLVPFTTHFNTCLEYSARALELDERLAVPHVHFGVEAMYLTDQWVRAGEQFTLATAKDPSYAEGHRFLAVWLGLDGRTEEALASAEEAARLEPDIVTMLGTVGAARAAVGDTEGAEHALRGALKLDPKHAPSRERLLRLLEAQERFAEAIAERRLGGGALDADGFHGAWAANGAIGYREARRGELQRLVGQLEQRLIEQRASQVVERFAPPVLRLVAALAELGEWTKVRAWQLQACAERPALARWFAAMPELRHAPHRAPRLREESTAALGVDGV